MMTKDNIFAHGADMMFVLAVTFCGFVLEDFRFIIQNQQMRVQNVGLITKAESER